MKNYLFIGLFFIAISGIYNECDAQIDCQFAYYYLNGDAIDYYWHHYDGILHGTMPTIDRFGNINNALEFNGMSDYVLLPSLFDKQERVVDLWFLAENIGLSEQTIYASDCNSLQYGRTLISVNSVGGTKLNFDAGGSQFSYPIIENQWYRATISVGVDSTKFYLNGLLISAQVTGIMHSTNGLNQTVLGSNHMANANFFKGKIDSLVIYVCPISGQFFGINLNERDIRSPISIFPNPATNTLYLDGLANTTTAEVYDVSGKILFTKQLITNQLDISTLAKGLYFIKHTTAEGSVVRKFVKE
jgi:hypothetical protein